MPVSYTLTTFDELTKYVDAFMRPRGLRLLFLIGDPGGSKSRIIKDRLKQAEHVYIKAGRLTAFQLYKLLYRHRNKTIILDDVEDALKREDTRRLLMMVCETDDQARKIGWLGTESQLVVRKGKKLVRIPQEFKTSSRVCIVCNNWDILSGKFGPLLDRGVVFFFDPSNVEIHSYVGGWFGEEDIYQFIGGHLKDIGLHSIRYYVNAAEMKRQGLDWKAALLESWTNEARSRNAAEEAIKKIVADPQYQTEEERVAAFECETGLKRRSYFYYKKKLGL